MNVKALSCSVLLSSLVSVYALAGDTPPPPELTLEEQVQTNTDDIITGIYLHYEKQIQIDDLNERVSELEEGIDFNQFLAAPGITQKIYTHSFQDQSRSCVPTESVWTYTRNADNSVTQRREIGNSAELCSATERTFATENGYRVMLSRTSYDRFNPTQVASVVDYVDPIKLYKPNMQLGEPLIGATAGGSSFIQYSYVVNGLVDVTVPYNGGTTFTGCLERRQTWQTNSGTPSLSTFWVCPGVGMVKRFDSTFGLYELSDMVVN